MPIFGAIPHGGNLCTYKCESPCPHWDCPQCEDRDRKPERKRKLSPILELSSPTAKITREALEGLCARAAITMEWNDGNPVLYDKGRPWIGETKSKNESLQDAIKAFKPLLPVAEIKAFKPLLPVAEGSAEDIAAAKALLEWKPDDEEASFTLHDPQMRNVIPALTQETIRAAIESLKNNNVPGPYTAILHPDGVK